MTVFRFALLFLLATLITLAATGGARAAEPQWIWSTKDAATKAEAGEVAFRKTFSVDTVESATITITVDNRYDLFVNGRHVGSGEGWASRTRYDIKPLLIPGRNLIAVRATNAGADPAGLAAQLEVKPQGKDAVQIPTDATWKVATKFGGPWITQEFDDSKWANTAALGEYGKSGPWGKPGAIVEGQAVRAAKPRNTERGLFEFKDGDRLVLLGSAFIERMQNNGYFELELISAFPDKNITIRNLGWSGDTVWGDARAVFGSRADGFKRLVNDVNLCDPTVILVCYGENEAYAGEAGLEDFRAGFETLLNSLEATGARIVVATPRKHENVGKPFPDQTKYNADLRKYCDAMKEVAQQREHTFVDWFGVTDEFQLTTNGIHLTDFGYWLAAHDLIKGLGRPLWDPEISINADGEFLAATGLTVTNLRSNKREVSLLIHPRTLPAPIVDSRFLFDSRFFKSQGRGTLVDMQVIGLADGVFQLYVNDEPAKHFPKGREVLARGNATQWEEGLLLESEKLNQQTLHLLAAINEKNFLFFNRYRPQNETYLFLFRKHEQGNNAVEIPQFDPLIAKQEKIIAELKKPPKQKFELKRVSE
jgi:lysophospholipase L1-like esterase